MIVNIRQCSVIHTACDRINLRLGLALQDLNGFVAFNFAISRDKVTTIVAVKVPVTINIQSSQFIVLRCMELAVAYYLHFQVNRIAPVPVDFLLDLDS